MLQSEYKKKWYLVISTSHCESVFPSCECVQMSFDHYNTLVVKCELSSQTASAHSLAPPLTARVTSGKLTSFYASPAQAQKRDHNNNYLMSEVWESTNTTQPLKTLRQDLAHSTNITDYYWPTFRMDYLSLLIWRRFLIHGNQQFPIWSSKNS